MRKNKKLKLKKVTAKKPCIVTVLMFAALAIFSITTHAADAPIGHTCNYSVADDIAAYIHAEEVRNGTCQNYGFDPNVNAQGICHEGPGTTTPNNHGWQIHLVVDANGATVWGLLLCPGYGGTGYKPFSIYCPTAGGKLSIGQGSYNFAQCYDGTDHGPSVGCT